MTNEASFAEHLPNYFQEKTSVPEELFYVYIECTLILDICFFNKLLIYFFPSDE